MTLLSLETASAAVIPAPGARRPRTLRRHRVVAGGTEWVTPGKPLHTQPEAGDRAMDPDRLCHVVGAGREVPAGAREQRGDQRLVRAERGEQNARQRSGRRIRAGRAATCELAA